MCATKRTTGDALVAQVIGDQALVKSMCVSWIEVVRSQRCGLKFGSWWNKPQINMIVTDCYIVSTSFWLLYLYIYIYIINDKIYMFYSYHFVGSISAKVNWSLALAVTTAGRTVKLWDLCRGRCGPVEPLSRAVAAVIAVSQACKHSTWVE